MCLINAFSLELARIDSIRTEQSLGIFENFVEKNNVFVEE